MTDFSQDTGQLDHLQRAALALKRMRARLDALEHARTAPIAIIGMGCRLPGGSANVCGPDSFWSLLSTGTDAIGEVPPDRWDAERYYDPNPDVPGKIYTRWGGFLRDIGHFDAQLFGIAPREAISIDPQQRLLLEVAWEALEHAGQAPDALKHTRTGVFIGIGIGDYGNMQIRPDNMPAIDAYTGTGSGFCFASGRLSYMLGVQGPSLSVDTACSSSLVAIHLACQSLRAQECRIALAGGVNALLAPEAMLFLAKSRALSPTGRCRTFDAAADGFVRGEGCGVLVLKRLDDAVADGDTVLAVIPGSAINHDGPSSGLTVPNGQAQQALIRQALEQARLEAGQLEYVEAHGTGTNLGDPIELRALGAVVGAARTSENPLLIGSVKTNIGHLEAAAGVAGVIKTVLALHHEVIPPHLHFQNPSPHIPWAELPLAVPTTPIAWPRRPDQPRIAGVSSFGLSGTNAHVLVMDAPLSAEREPAPADGPHLLVLSAKSEAALRTLAMRYEAYLNSHPTASLADMCFTAATGRASLTCRLALVADSADQMRRQLADVVAGRETIGVLSGQAHGPRPPKIVFLCTGQGSQYVGMGRQLYATQPVFRQALDRCDTLLRPHLGRSLLSVLYDDATPGTLIDDTLYTQPALVALEYALAQLWQSWGITPAAVVGHSVGEYAAACIAGVFSLEDGLRLVAERARLMQSLPTDGAMLAVQAPEARVRAAIQPYVDTIAIAALNGPSHVVISGRSEAVAAVAAQLQAEGIKTRPLTVSHAFHSPLMQPILADFAHAARSVRYAAPQIDMIANLTGELAPSRIATPDYWVEHVLQPVQFAASVETLQQRGYEICLEIGPQPVLLGIARQSQPAASGDQTPWLWLPSLRQNKADSEQVLESLAALHVHGARIDWQSFYRDQPRRKLALPTYPFQQQRYWFDAAASSAAPAPLGHEPDHAVRRLPGRRVYSAAFTHGEVQFEFLLDRQMHDLVAHDPATGALILRNDAYMQIAQAVGVAALRVDRVTVAALSIQQPLAFPHDDSRTLHFLLTPDRPETYTLQVLSLSVGQGSAVPSWTCHATGTILRASAASAAQDHLSGHTPIAAETISSEYERWLYETVWQPGPANLPATATIAGSWLIFGDQGELGRGLSDLLRAQGAQCVMVQVGSEYARTAVDQYSVNPASPADFERLIEEWTTSQAVPCAGVVHLWSVDTLLSPDMSAAGVQQTQMLSCGSVLHLTQALVRAQLPALPRLWLVTRGSQSAARSGVQHPHQSPVWGLSYVIALEHPELRPVCVDLDAHAQPDDPPSVLQELQSLDTEQRVAYRGGKRYVARLGRYTSPGGVPSAPLTALRPQSTYLITGGLGALGLGVARWMIQQGADTLVLLGRRAPTPEAQAAVAALEQRGAQILVVQADVADPQAMQAVLERIADRLPPLRGVVHTAGVLADATLGQQSWQRFDTVFAPKAAGAWNLHLLTRDLPLEFFVCFSSVSSIFGSPGQGNYTAANAFLDGLAHYRRGLGLPATTINWGPWSGAGMEAANHERRAAQGLGLIEPQQGMAILGQLIRHSAAQVMALPVQWDQFLRQLPPVGLSIFVGMMHAAGDRASAQPGWRESLAALPLNERRAWLTTQLRSVIAQILRVGNPEEIPLRQGLFELGVDSLMALELRQQMAARSGYLLRQTFVFDYPMVTAMLDYFIQNVFPELFQPADDERSAHHGVQSTSVMDLTTVSDAEAEALLLAVLDQIKHS